MRTLITIAVVMVGGAGVLWAGGQNADNPEAAVKKAAVAYGVAMEKGDMASILHAWSAEADYLDENGKWYRGREAIGNLVKENLAGLNGAKVSVSLQSVRFLKPDVVVADGTIRVTPESGISDSNRFTSVWMKKDDAWQIASARDLPDSGEAANNHLKALEWLIGSWEAKDQDTSVKLTCRWTLGRKYMQMEFTIKGPKEDFSVLQMLGWDPAEETLRSWMFDSRGGFGDGNWDKTGNGWEGMLTSLLPSAQTASAHCVLKTAGPNGFVWLSNERDIDGAPIPDHELKYARVGAP